jgi:hypothetical protein
MSEAGTYGDANGGAFDLESLRRQYRRREATAPSRQALAAIEREILAEIASQSGRYGERLALLLETMRELRAVIEQATVPGVPDGPRAGPSVDELNAHIARYNALRCQAQQVQYYLIIHREAMGFWNHDDVFRLYPIPASLTPLPESQTRAPPEPP